MTDIIRTAQLQEIDSALIVLYELEYVSGSFAYFFAGFSEEIEGGSPEIEQVQFREFRTGAYVPGTVLTYTAIPIEAEGFDVQSDGAYSRPTLTIANLKSVFTDAIGGLSYEDLIGAKITKRTTMYKYLVGESSDVGPGLAPIEYPRTVFYIDRIKEKNPIRVTFELAAPFDLAGITLPRRVVIGGACPFKYKGASRDVSIDARIGGCDWRASYTDNDTEVLYVSQFDEYIVPDTLTFTTFAGSATAKEFYRTPRGVNQLDSEGVASPTTAYDYWQALRDTSGVPGDADRFNWRRVRVYRTHVPGQVSPPITYIGYKENKYNEYVLEGGTLWRVKLTSVDPDLVPFEEGRYWTAGDVCGKKIKSCAMRYQAKGLGVGASPQTIVPDTVLKTTEYLRFGGFPGVQQRR